MIKRVTSTHPDFKNLVHRLDKYLAAIDGEEHCFYNTHNSIANLPYCVVYYQNDIAVGCGAIKEYNKYHYEVKRMYVKPEARGKGIAKKILASLEKWSLELGATHTLLETGKRMPDAIGLYHKVGYKIVANYEPYVGIENSICLKKCLS